MRMENPVAVQVDALEVLLLLLVGLLLLLLLLLFLLNGLFLLRWRPAWRKGKGLSQASPQLLQVVPDSAEVTQDGKVVAVKRLLQPGRGEAGFPATLLPFHSSKARGPRAPHGPKPPSRSRGLLRNHGAAQGMVSSSSSTDLDKQPPLVPPNSPVAISGTHGVPDGVFPSCHTSTQSKLRSCSRLAGPTQVPFEYGSSIQRNDGWALVNSASYTASQGPGLDTDFGASAGVSVRILSSGSEESLNTPLLRPQQSGQFEWDYYDPSYKRQTQFHQQLPQICSKQYWL